MIESVPYIRYLYRLAIGRVEQQSQHDASKTSNYLLLFCLALDQVRAEIERGNFDRAVQLLQSHQHCDMDRIFVRLSYESQKDMCATTATVEYLWAKIKTIVIDTN